jgi:hypothetical protein
MRSRRTGLKVISVLAVFAAMFIALRSLAIIGLHDEAATGQVSVLRSTSFMPASGSVAYQGSPSPPQPAAPTTEPTGPRTPHAPPAAGEVRTLTIKDLGNFNYNAETGGTIPDDVRRLDGMTVRLSGYMVPPNQANIAVGGGAGGAEVAGVTRFSLVPSLFSCCYGQPPGVQHVIDVQCREVPFTPKLVTVEGQLKVGEVKDDGFVVSLFSVIATDVRGDARGDRAGS